MEKTDTYNRRIVRLTTELIAACRAQDAARVEALLDEGASPHLRHPAGDKFSDMPVHAAADAGSIECLQILLDRHANINAIGALGKTPLALAIANDRIACAQFMLKHRADPRSPDSSGMTPLHYAAFFGVTELLQPLLDAGAYIDEPAHPWTGMGTGATPLMTACSAGQLGCATALLAAGAQMDYCTPDGHNALTAAARAPDTECLDLLLKADIDRPAPADSGTPLYVAIEADRTENVRILLPIETEPAALAIAAAHAVSMENTSIVRMFLDDPRSDSYIGNMLRECMRRDHSSTDVAHMVLDAGAYTRVPPEDAEAFLRRLLVQPGHATGTILSRLVRDNGIDLNETHGFDRAPIEVVAGDYADSDRMALLMDLGADPHRASNATVFAQDPQMLEMIRAFDAARAIGRVLGTIDKRNAL